MQCVTVDTGGIQGYVFGSNRLQENIGASHLVALATDEWVVEALRKVELRSNIAADGALDDHQHIEQGDIDAELIYAGGGNALVLFRRTDQAERFTRELSTMALARAPGLQLHIVVGKPFDWGNNSLKQAHENLAIELAEQKQAPELSAPLLGLGVTRPCQSTGLPATGQANIAGEYYPAHASIHAKLAAAGSSEWNTQTAAEQRLYFLIPPPPGQRFTYPRQFDQLGRSEQEHSYIAVVHADGDSIGERIKKLGGESPDNRAYIDALRAFSQALKTAGQSALTEAIDALSHHIVDGKVQHPPLKGLEITLQEKDGALMLPVRPLVFGGDDVTLVCDGRLGVALAIEYIRRFSLHTRHLPDGKGPASASAGIAIVKSHYPFARAYELAVALSRSAKDYRREPGVEGPCLDWHFATGGLGGSVAQIRRREYQVPHGKLNLRPVSLEARNEPRSWQTVSDGIAAFQDSAQWAERRNKVKALREALRGGPHSVEQFLHQYRLVEGLPAAGPNHAGWTKNGWHGDRCLYFDAIEMADWHITLD